MRLDESPSELLRQETCSTPRPQNAAAQMPPVGAELDRAKRVDLDYPRPVKGKRDLPASISAGIASWMATNVRLGEARGSPPLLSKRGLRDRLAQPTYERQATAHFPLN